MTVVQVVFFKDEKKTAPMKVYGARRCKGQSGNPLTNLYRHCRLPWRKAPQQVMKTVL
jgi:hypothetical protein